jgi:hypothetical protein
MGDNQESDNLLLPRQTNSMTLLERASEFVMTGHPRDQALLLSECVRAHDLDGLAAVQRLYEDMYGGITFNFELKVPAALCLITWGEQGINALIEATRRTPTSKNVSITVQTLSAMAAGTMPNMLMRFADSELRNPIDASFQNDPALRSLSRQRLTEFMLSLPDDEVLHVAGAAFQQLSLEDGNAAKELFAALASRSLAVGRPTLDRYRQLISSYQDDEQRFQSFFEDIPQLLDPLAVLVWPQPDLHGAKRPDFVVKRADGTYLIVEIETPAKPLVTGSLQISAPATQAVTQANAVSIISP